MSDRQQRHRTELWRLVQHEDDAVFATQSSSALCTVQSVHGLEFRDVRCFLLSSSVVPWSLAFWGEPVQRCVCGDAQTALVFIRPGSLDERFEKLAEHSRPALLLHRQLQLSAAGTRVGKLNILKVWP